MKEKKPSNLKRLLGYAGGHAVLTYLSWILAAGSALIALLPFWYIWRILDEVLAVAPNFEGAVHITRYGWMAVLFAVLGVLVYIAALMCSLSPRAARTPSTSRMRRSSPAEARIAA